MALQPFSGELDSAPQAPQSQPTLQPFSGQLDGAAKPDALRPSLLERAGKNIANVGYDTIANMAKLPFAVAPILPDSAKQGLVKTVDWAEGQQAANAMPEAQGFAENATDIVSGLAPYLAADMATGGVAGSLPLINNAVTGGIDRATKAGVSAPRAIASGLASGATDALMMHLPMANGVQRVASAFAMPAIGATSRAAQNQITQSPALHHDALDPKALITDLVMGSAFSGLAYLQGGKAQRPTDLPVAGGETAPQHVSDINLLSPSAPAFNEPEVVPHSASPVIDSEAPTFKDQFPHGIEPGGPDAGAHMVMPDGTLVSPDGTPLGHSVLDLIHHAATEQGMTPEQIQTDVLGKLKPYNPDFQMVGSPVEHVTPEVLPPNAQRQIPHTPRTIDALATDVVTPEVTYPGVVQEPRKMLPQPIIDTELTSLYAPRDTAPSPASMVSEAREGRQPTIPGNDALRPALTSPEPPARRSASSAPSISDMIGATRDSRVPTQPGRDALNPAQMVKPAEMPVSRAAAEPQGVGSMVAESRRGRTSTIPGGEREAVAIPEPAKTEAAVPKEVEASKTEPAEVVKEAVKVAEKEGTPLKEQKKYLIENIEDAIKDAPDHFNGEHDNLKGQLIGTRVEISSKIAELAKAEARKDLVNANRLSKELDALRATEQNTQASLHAGGAYVTIHVPDDGTFEVFNSKAALKAFRENVSKMFPASDAKGGTKGYGKPPKPSPVKAEGMEDAEQILATKGLWHGNGQMLVKGKEQIPFKGKQSDRFKGKDPAENQSSLDQVVPKPGSGNPVVSTDYVAMSAGDTRERAGENGKFEASSDRPIKTVKGESAYVRLTGENGKTADVNQKLFLYAKQHYPKAEIRIDGNDGPVIFVQGGETVAVVMPMRQGKDGTNSVTRILADRAKAEDPHKSVEGNSKPIETKEVMKDAETSDSAEGETDSPEASTEGETAGNADEKGLLEAPAAEAEKGAAENAAPTPKQLEDYTDAEIAAMDSVTVDHPVTSALKEATGDPQKAAAETFLSKWDKSRGQFSKKNAPEPFKVTDPKFAGGNNIFILSGEGAKQKLTVFKADGTKLESPGLLDRVRRAKEEGKTETVQIDFSTKLDKGGEKDASIYDENDHIRETQRLQSNYDETYPGRYTFKAVRPEASEARAAVAIGEAFGRKVVYIEDAGGKDIKFEGVAIDSKTIFINSRAEDPYTVTVGHELVHSIKRESKTEYDKLLIAIAPEVRDFDDFHERLNFARTRDGIEPVGFEKAAEELLADFIGARLADKQFWNRLSLKEPTVFQKTMALLSKLWGKLSQFISPVDPYFKNVQRASDAVADVLADYNKSRGRDTVEPASSGMDFSVKTGKEEERITKNRLSDLSIRLRTNPTVGNAGAALSEGWRGFLRFTSPQNLSADAKLAAESLREAMGRKELEKEAFYGKLDARLKEMAGEQKWTARALDLMQSSSRTMADKIFNTREKEANFDFISRIQKGEAQPTPEEQAIADTVQSMFREKANVIYGLGNGALNYVRINYFPGIWKKSDAQAMQQIMSTLSKRPLEGSKDFLKAKVFDDIHEGLEAGFTPISNNPLDLVALKMAEMDKYILANRSMNELKGKGMVDVLKAGERVPEGMERINEKYGTVFAPDGDKIYGNYIAKAEVAQVFNNYLSQNLYNNKYVGGAFTAYMGVANTLNRFQLGVFSAFHAGFTSMEAVISHSALGVKALSEGNFKEAGKYFASAPKAWIDNPMLGDKIMQAIRQPGLNPEMAEYAEWARLAGAKIGMDQRFQVNDTQKMLDAWSNGNKWEAAAHAPFAVVEQSARPILEWLVPRQKFGVFGEMADRWVKANPDATHDELRTSMQQIWNRVDSRLGQVVYDRLFVHNVAKNAIQALVRAPGWTGGTILEVGGGGVDLVKYLKDVATPGAKAVLTDRAAYALSLVAVTAISNAVLTAMFTGEGPQDVKDLIAFRTGGLDEYGRPERFILPTYMKDLYSYYNDPVKTLNAKAHPLLSLLGDVKRNKDFYGTEIRHTDDNPLQQAGELAAYGLKAFVPFWMRGAQKQQERGELTPMTALAPMVGVMPAPADYTKSAAEKVADQYMMDRLPQGARTSEEFDKSKLKRDLRRGVVLNDGAETPELKEAMKAGQLSRREYHAILKGAKEQPLQRQVDALPLDQALTVYSKATDAEKDELKKQLIKKAHNFMQTASPEDVARMKPRVTAILEQ